MPDARRNALTILNILDRQQTTLDQVVDEMHAENAEAFRRDRALANALVYGVVRWRGKLDWMIRHFSRTPLKKIDPNILNILRIGVFQILYMDRIPDSAAVNTSVELAKPESPVWVIRYVNGLLRNVVRHHPDVSFPSMQTDPVNSIAASKSFPGWLIEKWIARFGMEETIAMCDAANTIPPITLRTNTLKVSTEKLKEALSEETESPASTGYSPYGLKIRGPKAAIPELAAFQKGWFQVQDEAAQLVAMLANPNPEETILDACAGLGGKTAHLAQMMGNRGHIIAMDSNTKKLNKLESEMNRLGVKTVETCRHDLSSPPSKNRLGMFDCILLDAPCSGLGVIRRNPDIKWSEAKKNLIQYQQKQLLFLSNLAHLVKPGGRMIYAVCSTEEEENEHVIESFLATHPEFRLEDRPGSLPDKQPSILYRQSGLKTFPHLHDMDGFFSVCLKRQASC
ncbi:MAG: 16S rRNA (cytosine(967)-C(5))-methyltransferase RsmB [Desulfobacterales bacterium]